MFNRTNVAEEKILSILLQFESIKTDVSKLNDKNQILKNFRNCWNFLPTFFSL